MAAIVVAADIAIDAAVTAGIIGVEAGIIASAVVSLVAAGLGMLLGGTSKKENASGGTAPGATSGGVSGTTRGSNSPRQVVYGETIVGGQLLLGASSDTNNAFLNLVIALASHRVYGFTSNFFDGVPTGPPSTVPVAGVNPPWALGVVTAGRFSNGAPGVCIINRYNGTQKQAVDAVIQNEIPQWDSAHPVSGVAYAALRLGLNANIWPTGIPNPTFIVKGRMMYDPRRRNVNIVSSEPGTGFPGAPGVFITDAAHGLDVGDPVWILGHEGAVTAKKWPGTGTKVAKEYEVSAVDTPGDGTQFSVYGPDGEFLVLASGGTGGIVQKMSWTNNSVICVRDYLAAKHGVGCDDSKRVDDVLVEAEANICDEMVPLAQVSANFTGSADADQLTLSTFIAPGPLNTGDEITVSNAGDGALPAPLVAGTVYYAVRLESDPTVQTTLKIAETLGNALNSPPIVLDLTTDGSGTNILTKRFQKTFTVADGGTQLFLEDDLIYFATGDQVMLSSTGALPTGFATGTPYYAIALASYQTSPVGVTPETFGLDIQLAATLQDARDGVAIGFSDGGFGTHTITKTAQPRYTCDGVITADQKRLDVITNMLSSCGGAGSFSYWGGKYRIRVAGADAPDLTIDASWLAQGEIDLSAGVPYEQLFNAVRGTFVDSSNHWVGNDFPPLVNPDYEQEDGGARLWRDLNFPYTNDATRCQRLANVSLQKSRLGQTFGFTCNYKALRLYPWRCVTIDLPQLGINGTFRVLRLTPGFDPQQPGIAVIFQQEDAAAYDWEQGRAQTVSSTADVTIPTPFIALPPVGMVLASGTAELFVAGDGTVHDRIRASWTQPPDAAVVTEGYIDAQYKPSGDANWIALPSSPGDQTSMFIAPVDDGASYDVRIRSRNRIGSTSDWVQQLGYVVVGKEEAPSDIASLSIVEDEGLLTLQGSPIPDLDTDVFEYRFGAAKVLATTTLIGTAPAKRSGDDFIATLTAAKVPTGLWWFAVRAKDTSGNFSADPCWLQFFVSPPPAAVKNFSATLSGNDLVVFRWDPVDTATEYDIRYGALGITSWDQMFPLSESLKGTEMANASIPPGNWLFAIRSHGPGGLSVQMTTAVLTVKNVNIDVAAIPQGPAWSNLSVTE